MNRLVCSLRRNTLEKFYLGPSINYWDIACKISHENTKCFLIWLITKNNNVLSRSSSSIIAIFGKVCTFRSRDMSCQNIQRNKIFTISLPVFTKINNGSKLIMFKAACTIIIDQSIFELSRVYERARVHIHTYIFANNIFLLGELIPTNQYVVQKHQKIEKSNFKYTC